MRVEFLKEHDEVWVHCGSQLAVFHYDGSLKINNILRETLKNYFKKEKDNDEGGEMFILWTTQRNKIYE